MQIRMVQLSEVIPYARNPRKNESAIGKVAASIREFGFRQPIVVDPNLVIVVGHTRLEAARRLGLTEVPVHIAEGLSAAQLKAYRLADNRLHEDAEWDPRLLECEMLELKDLDFDLGLTGFEKYELDKLLANADGGLLPGADEDAAPDAPEIPETVPGELIVLGRHRLYCGDATNPEHMAALLNGAKVDITFTDPPYNCGYAPDKRVISKLRGAAKTKHAPLRNDFMQPAAYMDFLRKSMQAIATATRDGGAVYFCHQEQYSVSVRQTFGELFHLAAALVWDKTHFSIGPSDYHWQHEPILYGWRHGTRHTWHGDRKQTSVWSFARERGRDYVHPTQKPVALAEKAIRNSSQENEKVLDAFGGSGSTLMAAEKAARSAYLMELEPGYCDVIVKRWESATGKRVERFRPKNSA